MQGDHAVFLRCDAELIQNGRFIGTLDMLEQAVDHGVADEEDFFIVDPFTSQMLTGQFFRGEQIVGHAVSHEAVDLFGHAAVEAAQSGFDMGNWDSKLGGGKRRGKRRIDIADNDHHIGLLLLHDRLDAHQHLAGLLRVTAGTDTQVDMGLGHAEVDKKELAHLFVIVLAGMYQNVVDIAAFEFIDNGCNLHKVGTRTDNT